MKKFITLPFLICLFLLPSLRSLAQGLEDFTHYPETGNAYHDGTFSGLDGSTWTYWQCRGDSAITAPTPTLGKNRTPASEITSGLIANGMGTLSFDYKQVFSTNVALDVKVNGVLLTTVTSSSEQGAVKNSGTITVNIPGTVTLTFIQASTSAGQVAIDNVNWTAFGGGTPDPEPSNYPTTFTASGNSGLRIYTSWTDALGTQLPAAYLIKISKTDNNTTPVDGTFTSDDLDFSDGKGAKNVMQGVQGYIFTGLEPGTTYYLKIFPYTNAGSLVDYKTDGTAPSASARTQAVLLKQDFNTGLAPWTEISIFGDNQHWTTDTISGVIFAKMTGFVDATTTIANEDWLISPAMHIVASSSPKLEFISAMNYGTGTSGITLLVSTDYTSGDPASNGTWTDLTPQAAFSTGGWFWTSSGFIDLSAYEAASVHIAFKYTCDAANAPTWEIDDVYVTNNSGVGIGENNPSFNLSTIYPNPCTNGFNILLPSNEKYRVAVYSAEGVLLLDTKANRAGNYIATGNLPTGIYMVAIENVDSHVQEMHKLMVK